MDIRPEHARIAVVYDWLDSRGGVERVLEQLIECIPNADIFTAHYNNKTSPLSVNRTIHSSFMQRLPQCIVRSRILSLPFYPYVWETFDFSGYDLVISVTAAFAKGIITKPQTRHIAYLLTPTRFLWSGNDSYLREPWRIIAAPHIAALRRWDLVASTRPDVIYSISDIVAHRCLHYYRRESEVLYPGLDVVYWQSVQKNNKQEIRSIRGIPIPKSYFLIVARLVPYKRIDQAIDACNGQNDMHLVIVGDGSEFTALRKRACDRCHFLGYISDAELSFLYTHAEALLMPQQEDFGLVALEAIVHQCPVISYQKSGVSEIIIDGETGILYPEQTTTALLKAIARFHTLSYNRSHIYQDSVKKIESMNKKAFQENWRQIIAYQLQQIGK